MNTKHFNSEKGQAIVYLVIGLVVFLGFVALAIDGGMVLADRRDAQNATDASALAGAWPRRSDWEAQSWIQEQSTRIVLVYLVLPRRMR